MTDTERMELLEGLSYISWRKLLEFLKGNPMTLREAADGMARHGGNPWEWLIAEHGVHPDIASNEVMQAIFDHAPAFVLKRHIDKAVADEREACAKVCQDLHNKSGWERDHLWIVDRIEEAIRARGTAL
jgi:hypothetical protein